MPPRRSSECDQQVAMRGSIATSMGRACRRGRRRRGGVPAFMLQFVGCERPHHRWWSSAVGVTGFEPLRPGRPERRALELYHILASLQVYPNSGRAPNRPAGAARQGPGRRLISDTSGGRRTAQGVDRAADPGAHVRAAQCDRGRSIRSAHGLRGADVAIGHERAEARQTHLAAVRVTGEDHVGAEVGEAVQHPSVGAWVTPISRSTTPSPPSSSSGSGRASSRSQPTSASLTPTRRCGRPPNVERGDALLRRSSRGLRR